VLLSDSAGRALGVLDSGTIQDGATIARRARRFRSILLEDCLHGEVVNKGAIPRALQAKHGLENLYVEDLPSFWRMLYTVTKWEGRRVVVVVEIVDHKGYSRWFPGDR
jgi:hypothetical protein